MSNTFFSTKSILSFFLVLLFAFSLTACSLDDIEQLETDSDNDEDFNITDTSGTDDKPMDIALEVDPSAIIDGYTRLQSLYLVIDGDDTVPTIKSKAKRLGLYVYEYDGGAGFWDLQISETECISEGYGSEQYKFSGDYLWITFEKNKAPVKGDKDTAPIFHVYYQQSHGYDVRFDPKAVVGRQYSTMRGVYAVDYYDTAKAALEVALNTTY